MALRVGIIGNGGISNSHMLGYNDLGDRVEVVACCDIDEAKARGFSKAFVCTDPDLVKFGVTAKVTDILEVFRVNRAFLALCIHGLLQSAVQAANSALGTYMYSDVLGNMALMSIGTAAGMPVSLILLSIAPKISRKIGSQKVLRGSLLIGCALYVALFTLHVVTNVNVWAHIAINAIDKSAKLHANSKLASDPNITIPTMERRNKKTTFLLLEKYQISKLTLLVDIFI